MDGDEEAVQEKQNKKIGESAILKLPKLVVYKFEGTTWIDSGSGTNATPRLMNRTT